jgi:hypothetical protein
MIWPMTPMPETGASFPVPCVFCGRPALRKELQAHPEARSYDVDCDTCGKYRVSKHLEGSVTALAGTRPNPWLRLIAQANAAGERLAIPSGVRISLDRDG